MRFAFAFFLLAACNYSSPLEDRDPSFKEQEFNKRGEMLWLDQSSPYSF